MSERIRPYDLFRKDPQLALDEVFRRQAEKGFWLKGCVHIWTSVKGKKNDTRWGSYKFISRRDLEGRKYQLEFVDDAVGIFWLDAVYNEETHRVERLPEATEPKENQGD